MEIGNDIKFWVEDGVLTFISSDTKEDIKNVKIPKEVTSIGENAFYGCKNMTGIEIPESVKSIGDNAFSGCESLISVDIPDSVLSMGECVFSGCEKLERVRIPAKITNIEYSAFEWCKSLREIELPEGLKSIGDNAFFGCESLTNIKLPKSITDIGFGAFEFCESLKSIELPEGLADIGWSALNWGKMLLSIEQNCVGDMAFNDCSSLTEVNRYIDYKTYKKCFNGSNIPIYDNIPLEEIDDEREKQLCVKAFVRRGDFEYSNDIKGEYERYIKSHRKELYDTAVNDRPLLRYMLDNKMVPLEDIELILSKTDDSAVKAEILEYSNT